MPLMPGHIVKFGLDDDEESRELVPLTLTAAGGPAVASHCRPLHENNHCCEGSPEVQINSPVSVLVNDAGGGSTCCCCLDLFAFLMLLLETDT